MKTIIIAMLLPFGMFHTGPVNKTDKSLVCENGKIHFLASTAIEDIEATSNSAVCAIDPQTKKVSAKVKMTSFEFRRKKMQEDFNEDYIESGKYPYAILDAVIVDKINFTKDGTYNVTLKGTFEIHGVKRDREIKGKLTIKGGQPVSGTAQFDVKLVDHNIKVPTIVVVKIAEVVKVDVNFEFKKQAI
ncbi:MAG: YceI family protein [Bacteroidota bacterium]|nr:YceI family protein [Bacteroidota bacterium]